MKALALILLITLAPLCAHSQEQVQRGTFLFLSYNCENLFDCRHDSLKNDEEFLPEGNRLWSFPRYWKKVNDVARVIQGSGEQMGSMPDVVALVEVENDSTMLMLTRRSALKSVQYNYVMTNSPDVRGVDVALLYNRLTTRLVSQNSIRISPRKGYRPTRDILYAKLRHRYLDTVHVFVLHAPSRSGGRTQTEPYRMQVINTLLHTVDSIRGTDKNSRIIIAGDFNDYSYNKSLKRVASQSFREASLGSCGIYHPDVTGTYKYQGRWESLDHIFLSKGEWSEDTRCRIFDAPWVVEKDVRKGVKPFRTYLGNFYHGGLSDHLGLILSISSRCR